MKRPTAIHLGSMANLIVASPSHRTVYCLHRQLIFRDRTACDSVHLRKMAFRAVADINIVWRSKVIDAR
jgi:hypothetical protein